MSVQQETATHTRLPFTIEQNAIWLVALVGLILSMAALWLIRGQLEANTLLDFEWVAHNRTRALNHGIDNGLLAIASIKDLFMASERVESAEFQVFGESLLERYPGIHALIWVPWTAGPGPGGHSGYLPVTYIVPQAIAGYPLGFDFGSSPVFSDLIQRAQESRGMAASGRIAFQIADQRTEYGFVAVLPVFDSAHARPSLGRHGERPLGFVIGLFRLSDLAKASVSLLEPRGVEILLIDESAEGNDRFLYFYSSRLVPRQIGEESYLDWLREEDEPKLAERIAVADRQWSIVSGKTTQFRSAEAFQESPWVVLVAGLMFTLLLSFYLERIRENTNQRLIMEQRLKEREALFRQMTETVDEAFWAATATGDELLYLSPAYEKITGIATRDSQSSLLEAVHPEDYSILRDALHRISRDRNDIEVIHRIQRADGAVRWLRTRGFPVIGESGVVVRLVGFSEDITERKLADQALRESEAKLRDLFQQSPDIIMTVDRHGKILLMNRSVPELPADRAVGRNSLALMPSGFRRWYQRALRAVFTENVIRQFEYTTDDGTYWEGRIAPIRSTGPVTAAMVIASDVTEKRNLEAQSLRNARLASIGVLSAGVAHEINNPNNAIQFNAALVARAWGDITPILSEYYEDNGDFAVGGLAFSEVGQTLPKLLSDISANSERIRRIVLNLKHMARQDTGEYTETVDIRNVLEAAIMILHNQIQKYTDNCVLDLPEDLPVVKGNSQQLEQVFINVMLNALQALPDRGRGVFVSAGFREDRGSLDIEVRDEGCGVSERDLGRLTEPFFTTRTEAGGTGLGLSISRSIMEKHGGALMFQSELGKGTRVTIRIPAAKGSRAVMGAGS